jgi:hypothetical protein
MLTSYINIQTAKEKDAREIGELHSASWPLVYRDVLSKEYLDSVIVDDRITFWMNKFKSPKMGSEFCSREMTVNSSDLSARTWMTIHIGVRKLTTFTFQKTISGQVSVQCY